MHVLILDEPERIKKEDNIHDANCFDPLTRLALLLLGWCQQVAGPLLQDCSGLLTHAWDAE